MLDKIKTGFHIAELDRTSYKVFMRFMEVKTQICSVSARGVTLNADYAYLTFRNSWPDFLEMVNQCHEQLSDVS